MARLWISLFFRYWPPWSIFLKWKVQRYPINYNLPNWFLYTKDSELNIISLDSNPRRPCSPRWCVERVSCLPASGTLVQWLMGRTCSWAPSGHSFRAWSNPEPTQCFISTLTAESRGLDHSIVLPVPADNSRQLISTFNTDWASAAPSCKVRMYETPNNPTY